MVLEKALHQLYRVYHEEAAGNERGGGRFPSVGNQRGKLPDLLAGQCLLLLPHLQHAQPVQKCFKSSLDIARLSFLMVWCYIGAAKPKVNRRYPKVWFHTAKAAKQHRQDGRKF